MLIRRNQSTLFVVDEQARLAPAMFSRDQAVANTAILIRAATRLGVPVLASEQDPKGLGPTVPQIAALLPAGAMVEKLHFSCASDPGIVARVAQLGRKQIIVAGMEAHVCVLQTAKSAEQGLKVEQLLTLLTKHADSRLPAAVVAALKRWEAYGVEARTEVQVVLRVSRPEILKELRKSKAARFLGEPLGPTKVVVKRGAQARVIAALVELGLLAQDNTAELIREENPVERHS